MNVLLFGLASLVFVMAWLVLGQMATFWLGEHLSALRLPANERWKTVFADGYVSVMPAWMHRWPVATVLLWPVTSPLVLLAHARFADRLASSSTILPVDFPLDGFALPKEGGDACTGDYRLPADVPSNAHPRTRWLVSNLLSELNCAAAILIFAMQRYPGLSRWRPVSMAWIATTSDPFVAFYRQHAGFEALVTEGIAAWSAHGELSFTAKGLELLEQYRFPDQYIARNRRPDAA